MLPAPEICERARLARDPRFDGRFITAVLTTGIYCRPVCPARPPARENVRYFASAAAAKEAGYRPCRRCLPEAARRVPEWTISSKAVIRGLRLIDAGFLIDNDSAALARELGIGARHMGRLFRAELGASPRSLAGARRLHLAKRLIDESDLSFARIALQAGYGSVRRFNADIKAVYQRSPRQLRGSSVDSDSHALVLNLPVREPYNHQWVFEFLRKRGLPGLEEVHGFEYRRKLDAGGHWISVAWQGDGLRLSVPPGATQTLGEIMYRVRRVFDLDADPQAVDDHLGADPCLGPLVAAAPGLRVPGAWDGFETAVRAIVGQQVSVARATTLAQQITERYGHDAFPSPATLADATPAEIGMPGNRGRAISTLARAVRDGQVALHDGVNPATLTASLTALHGIGPWTAAYIGMRVAKDPDAFPDSDWVILKQLGVKPAEARRRSVAWQPWRAYAVMYLWRAAGQSPAAAGQSSAAV
ncbi:MAG: helix-turn-helix domain-containing protein [Gammaproteobacteria bacterium]|nr:helix-turn-helix domain-containing protein [Gammaproteobacteria bacterium]